VDIFIAGLEFFLILVCFSFLFSFSQNILTILPMFSLKIGLFSFSKDMRSLCALPTFSKLVALSDFIFFKFK
jgi:hypothetical protein